MATDDIPPLETTISDPIAVRLFNLEQRNTELEAANDLLGKALREREAELAAVPKMSDHAASMLIDRVAALERQNSDLQSANVRFEDRARTAEERAAYLERARAHLELRAQRAEQQVVDAREIATELQRQIQAEAERLLKR
jgi:chromosome segregation ATPase